MHYKDEISFPLIPYKKGDNGGEVTLIQEWLNVFSRAYENNIPTIVVDGDFGPATERALKRFQAQYGLKIDGIFEVDSVEAITAPMLKSFNNLDIPEGDVSDRILFVAKRFADVHPVELPGNRGPWVRSFMRGHDGDWAAWCAGLVSTCVDLAIGTDDRDLKWTWSTVKLKQYAKESSNIDFFPAEMVRNRYVEAEPGDIFLVEKLNGMPRHTGIIVAQEGDMLLTIEGNTNDEGSREGWELVRRRRNIKQRISLIRL